MNSSQTRLQQAQTVEESRRKVLVKLRKPKNEETQKSHRGGATVALKLAPEAKWRETDKCNKRQVARLSG